MKTPLLLTAVIAGGIAGSAAAVIIPALFLPAVETAPPVVTTPGLDSEQGIADLHAKNSSLEERLRALESQVAMQASKRESAVADTPQAAGQVDLAAIEQLLASLSKPDQPAPAGLATMVERAIEDKETREREERDAERQADREQRLDERMTEMAEKIGMDAGQKESVRTALAERDQARGEFFETMRNGGGFGAGMDRDSIRTSMEELTNKTNSAIQSSLSPVQYEQYQESYAESGMGNWGRGGTRGGGGGRGN